LFSDDLVRIISLTYVVFLVLGFAALVVVFLAGAFLALAFATASSSASTFTSAFLAGFFTALASF
jgi:hypothetical protein